jgi:hypothetical protein
MTMTKNFKHQLQASGKPSQRTHGDVPSVNTSHGGRVNKTASLDPRSGKAKNFLPVDYHPGMDDPEDGLPHVSPGTRPENLPDPSASANPLAKEPQAKRLTPPAVNPGMARAKTTGADTPAARSHPDNFGEDVARGAAVLDQAVKTR